MRILKYIVKGQNIEQDKTCDFENVVRGSNNWLQLEFSFDKNGMDLEK